MKLLVEGEQTEAQEVQFTAKREEWNVYQTSDGHEVRLRTIVSQIFRTAKTDQRGVPIFVVQSQTMMAVTPMNEMKKSIQ